MAGVVGELVKNHQVTIITEQHAPDLPLAEKIDGAEVLRIPVAGVGERAKKWHIWHWVWAHRAVMDAADVIHVHDVVYWLYPYKLTKWGTPIFATFHGWEGIYPIPVKNIIKRNIDTALTTRNICVGDYIACWYGTKPDSVTYGATALKSKLQKRLTRRPTLLFLGRLEKDTGWRECINKYYHLKPQLRWQLIVAGDGPLKKIAPPEAHLLGSVPNPEQFIRQADYVFTSGYMGILEAFALGKPVLSHYANPLKKDYLLSHPMAKYLIFDDNISPRRSLEPQLWARKQTWSNLAATYLKLWHK